MDAWFWVCGKCFDSPNNGDMMKTKRRRTTKLDFARK